MNGIEPRKTTGFLFNVCRIPGPCSVLAQYLTIVEIWSLNTVSIYVLKFARRKEVDGLFDSFFEEVPPWYRSSQSVFRSTNFLEWCMQCKIPLQRLRVDMPPRVSKDSYSMDLKKLQDLKNATKAYFETYGASVLAIHLNFSTAAGSDLITNFVATHFILLVFQYCPNLIMLWLDGPALNFSQSQNLAIFKAARTCTRLRDWVFAGSTLLTSKNSWACDLFIKHVCVNYGFQGVRQLVLNKGIRYLRNALHGQYTLSDLRGMEQNNVLRISTCDSELGYYISAREKAKPKFCWCQMGR